MSQKCLLCQNQIKSKITIRDILMIVPQSISKICAQCSSQFQKLIPGCKSCSKMGNYENGRCEDCQTWYQKGADLKNYSIFQYNKAMSSYMQRYKFQGDYRLRVIFKTQFNQSLNKIAAKRLIVPIPISEATWSIRGFNQVTGWLENGYANVLNTQKVIRQSQLNRTQRLSMRQPFEIQPNWQNKIINQDILLVDDIYTTGTTLHLARQKLIEAGCRSVISFTLAR